ncbi:MAG: protein translocase subunit SecD [Phycisphaerae bacterium]
MSRWVYWVSLIAIAVIVGFPLYGVISDPQADLRDLFRLGIDLQGGTSLIYQLRAPEGAEAPSAKEAKRVITGRIDPQGTRGYTVRPIGEHRLEIVLPGRRTRVRIDAGPVALEHVASAIEDARRRGETMTLETLETHREALLAGTRLVVHLKPALWLDDVRNRVSENVRLLEADERVPYAVVGLEREDQRWEQVAVFVAVDPEDEAALDLWRRVLTDALATQRDVTRVKRLVGQAGFLEFRIMVNRQEDRDKANFDRIVRRKQAGQPPGDPRFKWYPLRQDKGWTWYKEGLLDAWNWVYVVDEEARTVEALVDVSDRQDVSGQDLSRAAPSTQNGEPIVVFSLKPEAGARMARLTRPEMRGRHMAILLDGVIQSAPVLKATLSSGGIIEGYDTLRERDEVVTVLNSGQLAASLGDPVTERTVGPELGADNIRRGFHASLIGFGLVVVFILIYYRFAGLVADFALLLNLVLIVCIMSLVRQAWTLPGIAGLILSLSMAIDANVLIFERLREEKGKEGSLPFALKRAYHSAFRTILDANITTLIPAFVLLYPGLATEEVKGFAVVMIIGIMVSMFTAVVVTRIVFETGIRWGVVRDIGMFRLFSHPNIDWMRFVRPAVVVSGAAAAIGAMLFFARGDEKYDIEFTGGTQVELALKVPEGQDAVSIDAVRDRVVEALGPTATVQELEYAYQPIGEKVDRFLISVPATGEAGADEALVKDALATAFADMRPELGTSQATVTASPITEDVIRDRMQSEGSLPAAGAEGEAAEAGEAAPAGEPTPEAAQTAPPEEKEADGAADAPSAAEEKPAEEAAPPEAAPEGVPAARHIPREYRRFLGMTRIQAEVTPPLPVGEVQRRIDVFLRDRYPDMVGTLFEVKGTVPAERAGEFKAFDIWVEQPFDAQRGPQAIPAFWSEIVERALGTEQTFASTTSFEPTMASEAWDKAVMAILLSLALMIVYVWVRFAQFSSGLAAVVALVHDVLITLGAVTVAALVADTVFGDWLMLADFKINLPVVGAFLTLVGYSINDTIVVFDRIRENRGRHGEMSASVVNNSINQVISRTVLTSTTTFLAVMALYIFAGRASTVHGLAFVMLFGTLVGTYSSIAIASPILVLREYLFRVYVWVYPIVGVGLLAYYVFVWKTPGAFFGTWQGWVWAVLQVGWVAVTWGAVRARADGQTWPLAEKSSVLVKALAAVSLLAPGAAVVLGLLAALARVEARAAWAGPAAVGALVTVPVTWILVRMAWGKAAEKS